MKDFDAVFDAVFDALPVNGWLSRPEALLLWDAAGKASGPILEVGAYYGRSSLLLAGLGRPLYCVDPFGGFDSDHPSGDAIEAGWRANLAACPNATLFRQRIEDWAPRPVGLAYLDGSHTYLGTRAQIDVALRCGAAVIAIHDVNDGGEGLQIKRAALEMLGGWVERVERLAVWEVKPSSGEYQRRTREGGQP